MAGMHETPTLAAALNDDPLRQQGQGLLQFGAGESLAEALAHAAPDVPQHKYAELGARYKHHYAAHQHDISLFDGVLPLLTALKSRQHFLTVATGKSRRGLDEARVVQQHERLLRDVGAIPLHRTFLPRRSIEGEHGRMDITALPPGIEPAAPLIDIRAVFPFALGKI
mgnify:CR=1 FL=1